MLGFPPSTEFNKRIPKQKFYENAAVPAAVKRLFADQLRCIYWRNKLAVSTLNLTAGERVTEIEIFELCLTGPKLDEAVGKGSGRVRFCLCRAAADDPAALSEKDNRRQSSRPAQYKPCRMDADVFANSSIRPRTMERICLPILNC